MPGSADTTQDAHEHAGITWEALLKSTLAIVTPSSCSRSSLSRAVPWRTSAFTLAPRSSKALAMRPPRLPVAPATTMVGAFMIPILEKGQGRCKAGADPGGGRPGTHRPAPRVGFLKSNSSRTCNSSRSAIRSSTSKPGDLMPRSIRLRKSTLIPTSSANSSWVSFRSSRIALSCFPNCGRADKPSIVVCPFGG